MGKLIYWANASLDGYIEDRDGKFDWTEPDEDVHTFINDLQRRIGTQLYGRRMYETMVVWEDPQLVADQPPYMADYAEIWKASDKIVYSRSLDEVSSARTRLEREFDPEGVRALKASAEKDIVMGGHELATQAFRAGLVDECYLFLSPIVVGGGKRAFPEDLRIELELVNERRFDNGTVYLHYRTRS
ncbi:MAG: dihydrofolate reductase family protein [Actinomycetota bacterium]